MSTIGDVLLDSGCVGSNERVELLCVIAAAIDVDEVVTAGEHRGREALNLGPVAGAEGRVHRRFRRARIARCQIVWLGRAGHERGAVGDRDDRRLMVDSDCDRRLAGAVRIGHLIGELIRSNKARCRRVGEGTIRVHGHAAVGRATILVDQAIGQLVRHRIGN